MTKGSHGSDLLEVTLGLVKTRDVEERNPWQGEQN